MSRREWLYWIRVAFAAVGMVAALVMFYEGSRRHGQGEEMLWLLSSVTMLLALVSGSLFTADCISSEKREDTLGFLFLTNLKVYDIVAGKIAINAITTTAGLFAMFPVFFLPLLAGGVTWAETVRVLLAICVSYLFTLSLGVWVSTRSIEARNAAVAVLATMFLLVVLPLLWIALLDELLNITPSPLGVPQLSPGMLLYFARDHWYENSGTKYAYWISAGLFLLGSIVFSALASRALLKAWQTEGCAEKTRTKGLSRDPRWEGGLAAWRRVNRLSVGKPFEDLFLRRRKVMRWGKVLWRLAVCIFVTMLLCSFDEDDAFVFALMTLFVMHAAAKFVFAFDATRTLNEDKRSSALELLLATPLSERDIADGQANSFRVQFRREVRRLFGLTCMAQFVAMVNPELHLRGDDFFFVSGFIWAPMIWTWSDYRVITWLGMRHALQENSHTRAMVRTFVDVFTVPWLPYFLVLFWMASANAREETAATVTFAWAIGGAFFQTIRAKAMRARIIRDFRMLVSGGDQTTREEGRFAKWWSMLQLLRVRTGNLARS